MEFLTWWPIKWLVGEIGVAASIVTGVITTVMAVGLSGALLYSAKKVCVSIVGLFLRVGWWVGSLPERPFRRLFGKVLKKEPGAVPEDAAHESEAEADAATVAMGSTDAEKKKQETGRAITSSKVAEGIANKKMNERPHLDVHHVISANAADAFRQARLAAQETARILKSRGRFELKGTVKFESKQADLEQANENLENAAALVKEYDVTCGNLKADLHCMRKKRYDLQQEFCDTEAALGKERFALANARIELGKTRVDLQKSKIDNKRLESDLDAQGEYIKQLEEQAYPEDKGFKRIRGERDDARIALVEVRESLEESNQTLNMCRSERDEAVSGHTKADTRLHVLANQLAELRGSACQKLEQANTRADALSAQISEHRSPTPGDWQEMHTEECKRSGVLRTRLVRTEKAISSHVRHGDAARALLLTKSNALSEMRTVMTALNERHRSFDPEGCIDADWIIALGMTEEERFADCGFKKFSKNATERANSMIDERTAPIALQAWREVGDVVGRLSEPLRRMERQLVDARNNDLAVEMGANVDDKSVSSTPLRLFFDRWLIDQGKRGCSHIEISFQLRHEWAVKRYGFLEGAGSESEPSVP